MYASVIAEQKNSAPQWEITMKIESSCRAGVIVQLLFLKENYEIIYMLYVHVFQLSIKSLSDLLSIS